MSAGVAVLGWLGVPVAVVAALRGMWSPCGLSMITSLNPVSECARGHRFGLTAAWYVAGAVVGGAVLSLGCALGAWAVARTGAAAGVLVTAALAAAAVAVVSDLLPPGRGLPVHPRQVNEVWLARYRRWVYAAGFGVQIGSGVATYVMSAAVYLTIALAVLSASPGVALGLGLLFGAVRGLGVLVGARARTPDALRQLVARLDRLAPASLGLCLVVELAVAGAAAATLAGPPAGVVAIVTVGVVVVGVLALAVVVALTGAARSGRHGRLGWHRPARAADGG